VTGLDLRLDRRSMVAGVLTIDAVASRRGVLRYPSAAEYYDPHEDPGIPTLDGRPVTVGHPASGRVGAGDLVVGTVRRPRVDGGLVRVRLEIRHAPTIARIDSGDLAELSCGYSATVEPVAGVAPTGERYDAVQRRREHDHVALIPPGFARCGSTCSVKNDCKGGSAYGCGCGACARPRTVPSGGQPRPVYIDAQGRVLTPIAPPSSNPYHVRPGDRI
jgi:hypothetical protein